MTEDRPNPYRNPPDFYEVVIGAVLLKSYLVEIDGLKTEDEWQVNKPTAANGAGVVFRGTKIPGGDGGVTLTLEGPDEDSFDDFYMLWDLLAPKPGSFGTATPTASTGSQYAVGVPSAAEAPSSPTASTSASSYAIPDGTGAPKGGAGGDVGPRPPTLPIQNALLAFHKITSIARRAYEGPFPSAGNSWRIKVSLIVIRPPTNAGVGQAKPAVGSQYAVGAAQGPGGTAPDPSPGGPATGV